MGCRKDKRHDRALPEMLINERDRYSKYYNDIDVDWYNWDTYLPEFACRCANAAKKKGYKYIGLQFWGELRIFELLTTFLSHNLALKYCTGCHPKETLCCLTVLLSCFVLLLILCTYETPGWGRKYQCIIMCKQ